MIRYNISIDICNFPCDKFSCPVLNNYEYILIFYLLDLSDNSKMTYIHLASLSEINMLVRVTHLVGMGYDEHIFEIGLAGESLRNAQIRLPSGFDHDVDGLKYRKTGIKVSSKPNSRR